MTKFLASVKNYDETKLIIDTPVDIIDLKNPNLGALGKIEHDEIIKICEYINHNKTVSSTIGDIENSKEKIQQEVDLLSKLKIDIIKIGFFDESYCHLIEKIKSNKKLVIVFFADIFIPDEKVIKNLKKNDFYGFMIDTAKKNSGSLISYVSEKDILRLKNFADSYNLKFGLAGSLRKDHISYLKSFKPSYLGFRGALCNKDRNTAIDKNKLLEIYSLLSNNKLSINF
tara:strand:+ start:550 stop:1233 length:684 start_codon:yes stop_codon:yes gene_type:complete